MSAVRVKFFVDLQLVSDETLDDETEDIGKLFVERLEKFAARPHYFEVELLDEPNPAERFFRFGTDKRRMREPLEVTTDEFGPL
jgi:hypothetical protein